MTTAPTPTLPPRRDPGDILALGFATTVATWAIGYVGHMPFNHLPAALFLPLMLACILLGGFLSGRYTPRGLTGGAAVGALSALLNLLILGSKLTDPATGRLLPSAALWIPGSLALSVLLATAGAALGRLFRSPRQPHWPTLFAWVTAAAALLLITAGGLVTGFRAGLSVPDWPNSYGSNMFLFPLQTMTEVRGAFYEHAHRLMGSLVGLTVLTLAIYLTVTHTTRSLRMLVWSVFAAIAFQGIMGGLRVTGKLTTSQTAVAPNPILGVIHGVFAHLVLAGLVTVAIVTTPRWRSSAPREERPTAGTDQFLTALLVVAVIFQTLLGAIVRQFDKLLILHITAAMFVAALALLVGMRAWGLNPHQAILRRLGIALLIVLTLQLTAGVLALVVRDPSTLAVVHQAEDRDAAALSTTPPPAATPAEIPNPPVPTVPPRQAIITTLHQTNAAALLGVAAMAALWSRRLQKPSPQPAAVALSI